MIPYQPFHNNMYNCQTHKKKVMMKKLRLITKFRQDIAFSIWKRVMKVIHFNLLCHFFYIINEKI